MSLEETLASENARMRSLLLDLRTFMYGVDGDEKAVDALIKRIDDVLERVENDE